jgi:hypothetical protein
VLKGGLIVSSANLQHRSSGGSGRVVETDRTFDAKQEAISISRKITVNEGG